MELVKVHTNTHEHSMGRETGWKMVKNGGREEGEETQKLKDQIKKKRRVVWAAQRRWSLRSREGWGPGHS